MDDTVKQSDVYGALVTYAVFYERLVYQLLATFFALSLPLAGVALGAANLNSAVQVFAAASGVVVSLVWYILVERNRLWREKYLAIIDKLESRSKQPLGRSGLRNEVREEYAFVRLTPRNTRLFSMVCIIGAILFTTLLALAINSSFNRI